MSLYLCIYSGDREIDGVEVGPYADFNAFRDAVARELGGNEADGPCPTLLTHSDCDGKWSPEDCDRLRRELASIATALGKRPAVDFPSVWQKEVARSIGLEPRNASECFIDVDGEFLIERLQRLAEIAVQRQLPILFQ
jgi:hypothetical protein